jgi:ankyrin repeat protein
LLCFEDGKTLLHWAFEQRQPSNILLLLEKGADLFQQDNDGKSALDLCPSDFRDEFLPIEFSEKALLQRDFALWFHLPSFLPFFYLLVFIFDILYQHSNVDITFPR